MERIQIRNLSLSRMTLGTVQLGLKYGIANKTGKPDERQSFALLQKAEEMGVNCFDTASQYGESEIVLGRYFKQNPNDDRVVVTKFKLDADIDDTSDQLEKAVRSQLEQSLLRLGVDKIPIYLLHQADDLHRHQERLVQILDRLICENLIGMAGVSVYHGKDLDQMLQYDLFQAVQIPINIFDQRLIQSGHLQRLGEAGIIVFARSVFLQGLFFMNPDELPEALSAAKPYLQALRKLADQEKLSVAQLALSFVRDLPGITSLVVGSETVEQVAENAQLFEGPSLSDKGKKAACEWFSQIPEIVVNPSLWQSRD